MKGILVTTFLENFLERGLARAKPLYALLLMIGPIKAIEVVLF